MLHWALRFNCRARLGFTTRHRRGLVRLGPESIDPLGAPAALRDRDDNRERGSRHHAVEQASLWTRRILAFGGPASPRTRLIANTHSPLGCIPLSMSCLGIPRQ